MREFSKAKDEFEERSPHAGHHLRTDSHVRRCSVEVAEDAKRSVSHELRIQFDFQEGSSNRSSPLFSVHASLSPRRPGRLLSVDEQLSSASGRRS